MKVIITQKQVYGETKYYPANALAICLAELAGTKTLTPVALDNLQRHGFEIFLDPGFGPTRVNVCRDLNGGWEMRARSEAA